MLSVLAVAANALSLVRMVPMPRSPYSRSRLCSIGFQAPSDELGLLALRWEVLSWRGQLEPAPDEGLPAGKECTPRLKKKQPEGNSKYW